MATTISAFGREPSIKYKEQAYKLFHLTLGTRAGYNSATPPYYIAAMREFFDEIRPGRFSFSNVNFLDLGSGSGMMVIYAAHHGLLGFGVEADESVFKHSAGNLKKTIASGMIRRGKAKIAHGNFFPAGFEANREQRRIEDSFVKYLPLERIDPYRTLGIGLGDVDVFYHYQVERRQNILNLVSRHGKSGAMLVFLATFSDSFEVPENMRVVANLRRLTLYRKN